MAKGDIAQEAGRKRSGSVYYQASLNTSQIGESAHSASVVREAVQKAKQAEREKFAAVLQNPQHPQKKSNFRGFLHGLYTGLCGLTTAAVGFPAWLISLPFTRSKKSAGDVTTEADYDVVPGSGGDKFILPDVAGGAPDQPILDDDRMIALSFAQEIPEDPKKKPTITLNFRQGKEGSSATLAGSQGNGHASVTIRYSKPDPFSGEMKRYESTIGFYQKWNGSISMSIAMAQNGMYMPGQLEDDSDKPVHIGKEYTVTNQQINKLILAAQHYEKGGYNLFQRNCATFVYDMAAAAGIEPPSYLKETDMTFEKNLAGGAIGAGMGLGLALLAPPFSRAGKRDLLLKAGKTDWSFQNFGGQMLNKDVTEKLSKRELNIRAIGFDPSLAGEELRKIQGQGLYSTAHEKEYGEKFEDESASVKLNRRLELVGLEIKNLAAFLKQNQGKRVNSEENDRELDGFLNQAYIKLLGKVELMNRGKIAKVVKEEPLSLKDYMKESRACAEILDETLSGMNERYLGKYEGNKKTNIAFQHMNAVLRNMKTAVADHIEERKQELIFVNSDRRKKSDEDYGVFIDMKRDTASLLKSLAFKGIKSQGLGEIDRYTVKLTEYIAGLKTFGSIENYVHYEELVLAESNDPDDPDGPKILTDAERKELHELKKRKTAMDLFEKTQAGFAGKRKFVKSDYKFVLTDLPNAEKEEKAQRFFFGKGEDRMMPSEIYQGLMLERIFGGLKQSIKEVGVDKMIKKPELMKTVISNHMNNRLMLDGSEEYKNLKDYLVNEMAAQRGDFKIDMQNEKVFREGLTEKANEKIMDLFKNVYLKHMMKDLCAEYVKEYPDEYEEDEIDRWKETVLDPKSLDFDRDPAYRSYREAIHKQAGIQPVLSAKHGEAIKKLADLQKMLTTNRKDAANTMKDMAETLKDVMSLTVIYEKKGGLSEKGSALTDAQINTFTSELKKNIEIKPYRILEITDSILREAAESPCSVSKAEIDWTKKQLAENKVSADKLSLKKSLKNWNTKAKSADQKQLNSRNIPV